MRLPTFNNIDLLQTFADQSVVAIQNARLFESVEARTCELAKSLLHDQTSRRGHRPWPLDYSRHHREATFRVYRGRYKARRVHRGQNYSAANRDAYYWLGGQA
jgi:hypothetical protein